MSATVAEAIEIIREARATHEEWIRYQNGHPGWRSNVGPESVGLQDHHQEWMEKYDKVLAVLERIGKENAC